MTRRRVFLILAALNAAPALLLTDMSRWAYAAIAVMCLLNAADSKPKGGRK